MKIIHFSDFHAGGPAEDWLAYLDKRWVGVFNYRFRRRFRHDQNKLRKAVEYILDTRPDVAICTGIDRYGLDLKVATPRGEAYTRVGFGSALSSFGELRSAAADLVHRARGS